MINPLINLLIAGFLGVFSIVMVQDVVAGTDTSTWGSTLQSVVKMVPYAIGFAVIIGIFLLISRLAGRGGEGGLQ